MVMAVVNWVEEFLNVFVDQDTLSDPTAIVNLVSHPFDATFCCLTFLLTFASRSATCELNGCSGRGTCRTDLATPTCECEPYYYGPDCSIGSLPFPPPRIRSPYLSANLTNRCLETCPGYPLACSGQGICQNNGTCNCSSQWEGADCSIPICPSSNGINCNDHGFCNDSSSPFFCQCFEGWSGSACEKGNSRSIC